MRFAPGTFDFLAVQGSAVNLTHNLRLRLFLQLPAGVRMQGSSRFIARANYDSDSMSRIVADQLIIREDGSGYGPKALASKIVEQVRRLNV